MSYLIFPLQSLLSPSVSAPAQSPQYSAQDAIDQKWHTFSADDEPILQKELRKVWINYRECHYENLLLMLCMVMYMSLNHNYVMSGYVHVFKS